jgi:hypothetical protein
MTEEHKKEVGRPGSASRLAGFYEFKVRGDGEMVAVDGQELPDILRRSIEAQLKYFRQMSSSGSSRQQSGSKM